MKLRDIAHARAGDKGNTSTVSLIVDNPCHYALIRDQITAARVKAWFGSMVDGEIDRYEVPSLNALNFVMHRALGGGVTRSLALDSHGKTRSGWLLEMHLEA
jgi:hypothetical protein